MAYCSPAIPARFRPAAKRVWIMIVAEMIEASIREKKETGVASGCSPLIRNTPWYINLDPHFKEFCFFEKLR